MIVLAQGDNIWTQGESPPSKALFLARGRVEYIWLNDGTEELVDVRDEGDLLGLTALIDSEPHRVTARVIEDSLFYSIEWQTLKDFLDTSDAALSYTRRHLFWATRGGRSLSIPRNQQIDASENALQAHLIGSKKIEIRNPKRLLTCSPSDSMDSVARQMIERRVPSMLIVDENRFPLGILTHSNIVRNVVVGNFSKTEPVENIMSSPVVTVAKNAYTTQAILHMLRDKIGQVCITEDGTTQSPALDVCSNYDLLVQSGQHPAGLLSEILHAQTKKRFRWVCDELKQIALSYLESGISATFLGQICAEIYDALTQRLIKQAKDTLDETSPLDREIPWLWMSVGSDGRREQILRTDMDNAIVFQDQGDTEKNESARDYFCKLAELVIDELALCGFSRCQGGVMALNRKWGRSNNEWEDEIKALRPGLQPRSHAARLNYIRHAFHRRRRKAIHPAPPVYFR